MAIKKGLKQGQYIPIHPEKWIITESFDMKKPGIKYRSSYEYKFMKFCDYNDNFIKVNSEGVVIPYISPKDNKVHRYYMDFVVQTKDGRIILVVVKPYSQCIPPKPPKNKTEKSKLSYQNAIITYAVNQAKWEAASKYAKERGWDFKIITEKELDL